MNKILKIFIGSFALVAFLVPFAEAKPIPKEDAFSVLSPTGVAVTCFQTKKGSYVPGKIKGKNFISAKDDLKKLQTKKANASTPKKVKKFAAQIKSKKKSIKDNKIFCKDGSKSKNSVGSASMATLDRAMTEEDVRYLFEKAGFGISPSEEDYISIGVNQGVSALVDAFMATHDEDAGLTDIVNDYLDNQLNLSTTQSPAGQRQGLLYLWANTHNPYAEKFSLFLLSVWTVSGDVISDETFRGEWWDYYNQLRGSAYGDTDLKSLANDVTVNPLMLVYLNNELNKKGRPNENYARELMELFLLGTTNLDGEANYTETQIDGSGDIAVAAKMLTGWSVKKNYVSNQLETEEKPAQHETGTFTMFPEESWSFTGTSYSDLINGIIDNHPNVKNYYAKEILKEYVTPSPSRELIESFGKVIKDNNYQLRKAMKVLFSSKAFYDEVYRNTVPKNPAEFAIELIRLLEIPDAFNASDTQKAIGDMGMQVNMAPSVFWYPQESWLNPSVMLGKVNLFVDLTGDSTSLVKPSPDWTAAKVLPTGAATEEEVISFAAHRLGIGEVNSNAVAIIKDYMDKKKQYNGTYTNDPYDNTDTTDQKMKGLGVYYHLLSMPEFSLK